MNHSTTKRTPNTVRPTLQIKCSDCNNLYATQVCRCSCHHFLCDACAAKSMARSDHDKFYIPYRMWCDTCIWFDLG